MRYHRYLRDRYQIIIGYTGLTAAVTGALNLVPLLLLPFYPREFNHAFGFLLAGVPPFVIGMLLWQRIAQQQRTTLNVQEGTVIIVLTWVIAILTGTIPFMTATGLNFTQAIFESTSGWTGAGLTVVNVAEASPLILFYRSFTQLAGGAGFAIIALSTLSIAPGSSLLAAEGRTDQLAPHVRRSANIVLVIYSGYTVFGILALRLAGMGWFDAVNHAFTALGTGGFSTRPESIAYWDSALIEAVLIVLMLIGAINFAIAYAFFKGKFRVVARSGELRATASIIFGAGLLLLPLLALPLYPNVEKAVRVVVFEAVSAFSTTGLATVDYRTWNEAGWFILTVLMILGGGVGSTAGGIKMLRVYILYKAVVWEIRRAFMPQHMVNEPAIWHGERRDLLNDHQVRQVAIFVGMYLVVYFIGVTVLVAHGYGLSASLFEFASTLSAAGMTVGITSPDMPPGLLWIKSLAMLMGRLEFFALFIGVFKLLRDGRSLIRRQVDETEPVRG